MDCQRRQVEDNKMLILLILLLVKYKIYWVQNSIDSFMCSDNTHKTQCYVTARGDDSKHLSCILLDLFCCTGH